MRFRSTVKQFDNQQSSDTLHAKLSKGENSALWNVSLSYLPGFAVHLGCTALTGSNTDKHTPLDFIWNVLLSSRRRTLKSPHPKETQIWCFIFVTGACMYALPIFRYRSFLSIFFPCGHYAIIDLRRQPAEAKVSLNTTTEQDWGIVGR